ncbi:hypothetical protein O6H91_02G090200 [Diphasiastrum complanatum]|uniref:Uncharacterized protein n=5 Tax=Diphasiastrum complanatum TaxID=34168 RepID=A0ACC2EIH7_DIPCM|nr:hypothetical protein O6H91_Y288300 [Diphasiastrum complanatum]KAJ7566146.1 hypothetical protein O6H91_02G090200 [Diphasiastrum complanatum]KAJ7566147.1 hypothetical protein O6H91_02G090200 [Diphasiastrum complanatum]KAJ7566148.1 hypothetical protein O6H91_02G090200 [Diphasiastrum complanatum]KAJ7566149.1 hypothetical protein O6H91_02G090200 [Diphasiastrum complanatum]
MEATFNSPLTHMIKLSALPCIVFLHSSSRASASPDAPACTTPTICCFPVACPGRSAACSSTRCHTLRFYSRTPIYSITALPNGFSTESASAGRLGSGGDNHHLCERRWVCRRGIPNASWAVQKVCRNDMLLRPAVFLGESTASPERSLGEEASQIAGDQTVEGAANNFISVLAVAAFLALFILTIGVVYLSVSDFMEKRSTDPQKKNAEKKKKAEVDQSAARIGPKGFGKKIRKRN